jgi:hypothetical protein
MIDLILVKTVEHALRALTKPRISFIIICTDSYSIYSNPPISIDNAYITTFVFPPGTTESYYGDYYFRWSREYLDVCVDNIKYYGTI